MQMNMIIKLTQAKDLRNAKKQTYELKSYCFFDTIIQTYFGAV